MEKKMSDTSSYAPGQGTGWVSWAGRGHRKEEEGKEVKEKSEVSNISWLFFKPLFLGTVK